MTSDVFDQIAESWYHYRHWSRFRPELEALAQRWQKGRLLNIGCGHGADFLPFKSVFELHGIDSSREMLRYALKYSQKFAFTVDLVQGDAACLPYADASFDQAISVATYHHIRGEAARRVALAELWRVLKPGGEAFITVWNRWQPRFWLRGREVMVPWRKRDRVLYRYYYLFTYPELERLVRQAGFEILSSAPESGYKFRLKLFSRNICLLVRKDCWQETAGALTKDKEGNKISANGSVSGVMYAGCQDQVPQLRDREYSFATRFQLPGTIQVLEVPGALHDNHGK